jgi:hypothetical protein
MKRWRTCDWILVLAVAALLLVASANAQMPSANGRSYVALSAVNPQTSAYQAVASDFSRYVTITVASGSFTITLVASASQPPAGQYIQVINYGSGTVTVAPSGQNINGGSSSITLPPGSALAPSYAMIESDGTNYFANTRTVVVGLDRGYGGLNSWALGSANQVRVISFQNFAPVVFANISYYVNTADTNASDYYDVGIYGPCTSGQTSCPLVAHIGSTNLTATGMFDAAISGGGVVYMPPCATGQRYYWAFTGSATTAALASRGGTEMLFKSNASVGQTGGSVLPSTITAPADSPTASNGALFILH